MIAKLLLSAGAMKAGTTWLQKQLQSHPNIRFKPAKEIDYFYYCSPLGKKVSHADRTRKYRRALDSITNERALQWYEHYAEPKEVDDEWYCSLFEDVPNDVYCADFSNRYALLTEQSLAKIQDVAKEVKIIYTLRDPLERLWSQVKFNFKFKNDEDGVKRMTDAGFRKFIDHPRFWCNADYLVNYQKLLNVFGRERVRLFYLEDFVAFSPVMKKN